MGNPLKTIEAWLGAVPTGARDNYRTSKPARLGVLALLILSIGSSTMVASAYAGMSHTSPLDSSKSRDESAKPGEITSVQAGWLPKRHVSPNRALALSASATPSAPFTECPPVGADTGCGLLIDVTDSGVSILQDPSQGPYDGIEDTLIGVLNQSTKTLGHLSLASNTQIFGFDGDGICAYGIPGCPFGPTGYEGPGTAFLEESADLSSGVVSFNPAISPGGSAYFSLEEPLSSTTVVSGGPSLTEQGGAPNRSEKHSTCSRGRPVNCATGVFWHEFTDASIPGLGIPLEFSRTYSSMNAATDGPLGFGWTDSYNMSLALDEETGAATIHEEGGSEVTFPSNGEGGFTTPPRVLATLEANEDGTYTFSRYADHIRYVFSASGQLLSEADRNGNTTTLTYSGGLLQSVTDPSGRSLTFTYTGSRIHTITDPMGRTTTIAYDGSGNLKEAVGPTGRKWSFTYDEEHRLLTMTDPRGGTTTNTYDSFGRVIAQLDPMGRKSTWSYEGDPTSPEGGLTIFTDARGDATLYEYANLELLAVTHGYETETEATTSYSYDPITLGVKTIIDPDGNETRNRYDSHGHLNETIDPLGRTTYYSYGFEDELAEVTDPAGTATSYYYDGSGNLLEKETPLTETGEIALTTYAYEGPPGELTSVTDPGGHTTQFSYDEAGDRTSVTDADGNETTYAYNADSELTSMVSPAGNAAGGKPSAHTTSYTYDAAGELTEKIDQLGHTTSYGYDGNGNRTSVIDANGHKTKQVYDADNELIEVVRPDSSILKIKWDAAGNMTAQIDAAGHTTSYAYDSLDRLLSTADPDENTTAYAYDPAGNKVETINAEGEGTRYEYDGDNELVSIEYSDGTTPSVYIEYDADGNRTELYDGTGFSTYAYDSLNRMTSTTDGNGSTVSYEYDLAGHVVGVTYPNDKKVARAYDPAGNLTSVEDWLGHTTKFAYSADSNLEKELYPNGVVSQRSYDNADRLKAISDTKGASQFASFSYTRDAIGQLTSESVENSESEAVSFARNSLDQLTEANATPYGYDAADNPTTFGTETTQQFDPANELTSSTGPGELPEEKGKEEGKKEEETPGGKEEGGGGSPPSEGGPQPPPEVTPAPAPRKRIHCRKGFKRKKVHGKIKCVKTKRRRHTHSKHRASASVQIEGPSGSQTGASPTSAPVGDTVTRNTGGPASASSIGIITRNFTYNARGDRIDEEVVGGSTQTLAYDQADRLIKVGESIGYAYNGDGLRTSKTVNGLSTTFVWNQAEPLPELLQDGSTYYIYGPEGQPIEQVTGTTPTYLHADQQGSTRLLTSGSGSVVGRYDYNPWGSVAKHSGSVTTNLQYDGQYTDSETGYQYLRARYYDPATGQFLTQDPVFVLSGARYGFANNNPFTYSDATGELFGIDTLLGAAIGGVVGTVSGAASYGVSVATGHEQFSWRELGASTAGGLVGGVAAGACEGTTWIGTFACGAAGGAIGATTTQWLGKGHVTIGGIAVGGALGGIGGVVGKLLFPLRGFVPYKLINVVKPGINSLRLYGQNAVGGLLGLFGGAFGWEGAC